MAEIDLLHASITQVSQLIRKRELSPVELTEACIRQSERLDPTLKAFTTLASEHALGKARQAETEIASGRYRGPLHGIPYTLKDVIATRDVRTTFGNPREMDFKPQKSATVHNLLENAGAVLLGKVYSHIGRGETRVMCYNPWDPSTSPGTTSGGSGAAVASGMGLLSIGTDTGGSVRHPASNCGVVGFKATFGRISRAGVWATSWTTGPGRPPDQDGGRQCARHANPHRLRPQRPGKHQPAARGLHFCAQWGSARSQDRDSIGQLGLEGMDQPG